MDNSMKDRIDQAIELFGKGIVYTVLELVSVADADGVYTTFEDMGMYEEAECTSYIFFEH